MGRTLPTATQSLEMEKDSWASFRRALRREDQEAFDDLWRWARRHTAPASMAGRPVPFESAVMSMLVELARRLAALEKEGGTSI
jgi:hypothetical protein